MAYLPDIVSRAHGGGNGAQCEYDTQVTLDRVRGCSFFNVRGTGFITGSSIQELWNFGGSYTFPTSASLLFLSSSDASDAAGGAGGRSVLIDGLGSEYERVVEVVALNGTGVVSTTGSYVRVNRVFVSGSGAHGSNRGTINVYHNATLLINQIASGTGLDATGIFTVPNGTRAMIHDASVFSGDDAIIRMRMMMRPGGSGSAFQEIASTQMNLPSFTIPIVQRIPFPPRTDVKLMASIVQNAAKVDSGNVTVHLTLLLVSGSYSDLDPR